MLKRFVQTASYLPHFISTVVVVGMLNSFFNPTNGVVNAALTQLFGYEQPIPFFTESKYFRTLYIGSGIWQSFGWDSIIYLAALTNIDPALYEAAEIDGASRWQRMWHIGIPGISTTVILLLVLRVGSLLNVGYEKIILMYSPAVYDVADVISTYVYRRGILSADFSFSTAIGLFNSVINFCLLIAVNALSRRISDVAVL